MDATYWFRNLKGSSIASDTRRGDQNNLLKICGTGSQVVATGQYWPSLKSASQQFRPETKKKMNAVNHLVDSLVSSSLVQPASCIERTFQDSVIITSRFNEWD
ncbi:predicted protein [Coccidioides posadasii str. Silveira]|uniref:Predicted protein n=1 Tax=Coccidioides posadasii (strain RMSCC 757 / Silveira) TaxID=443226 RepID=E9CWY0_COCPS|nr:predicted protein [Coccidioides posadasii str. Silveira]